MMLALKVGWSDNVLFGCYFYFSASRLTFQLSNMRSQATFSNLLKILLTNF